MKIIADFHIHSKYSRAVSQEMNILNIALWSEKKGVNVIGTGDFTHPGWFNEIKNLLEPAEEGLFKIKTKEDSKTRFILTTEIANIYSKNGKTRRIHNLIFAPSFEAVEKINKKLSWIGNLKADGRPMLGLDSKKLLEIILEADPRCVLIPAHAWTPWFSIFGSMSGFDSLEECFEEMTPYIFAIETGLSSDPKMNWRLSSLDKISLISNSDAHSPSRIGREANVFDCQLSYSELIETIKSKNPKKFLFTIEFFPEEGKYHYDGHRNCGISFNPKETKIHNGICPRCGRPLTIGVLNRVERLADREEGVKPKNAIPYKNLVPLEEIIAEAKEVGSQSKTVQEIYHNLLKQVGSEFFILLEARIEDIQNASEPKIAEAIKRVREGKVRVKPGYDGEYGEVYIFEKGEEAGEIQRKLF